jgi:hypothetical protein
MLLTDQTATGTQGTQDSRKLESTIIKISSCTERIDTSFNEVQSDLLEMKKRIEQLNCCYSLQRRVLVIGNTAVVRQMFKRNIERTLHVKVDVAASPTEAGKSWEAHRHSVLVISSDEDTKAIEFARNLDCSPCVILLTDNAGTDGAGQQAAESIGTTRAIVCFKKSFKDTITVIEDLLNQITPQEETT